jgi:hypothetical protein
VFDAELYLRLTGERLLLDSAGHDRGFGSPVAHAARALVAAGAIDIEAARAVVMDYDHAVAFRNEGMDAYLPSPPGSRRKAKPLAPRRVLVCDRTIERRQSTLHVRYVSLSDSETTLSVVERFAAPIGMGHAMHTPSATLADDRGKTVSAHFSGGGSAESWSGQLHSDDPLAVDTAWIEVDGERIELVDEPRAIEVSIEATRERDPVWRHLWSRLSVTEHFHHDAGGIELALDAMTAAGAVANDDPRLAELRAVAGALMHRRGTGTRALPEPWRSMLARRGAADGQLGEAAVGVVTPVFDGITVGVLNLRASSAGFELHVEVSPDIAGWAFDVGIDDPELAWWGRDDLGNHYVGGMGEWSGREDYGEGTIALWPGLHPKATRLDFMPTAERERAVISIPLELLRPGVKG